MYRNKERYLNYWWNPLSVIDPDNVGADYYKVVYDDADRYILVEKYNVRRELLTIDKFYWNDVNIQKIELFNASNVLEKYIEYVYDLNGVAVERLHYSPKGEIIFREAME